MGARTWLGLSIDLNVREWQQLLMIKGCILPAFNRIALSTYVTRQCFGLMSKISTADFTASQCLFHRGEATQATTLCFVSHKNKFKQEPNRTGSIHRDRRACSDEAAFTIHTLRVLLHADSSVLDDSTPTVFTKSDIMLIQSEMLGDISNYADAHMEERDVSRPGVGNLFGAISKCSCLSVCQITLGFDLNTTYRYINLYETSIPSIQSGAGCFL